MRRTRGCGGETPPSALNLFEFLFDLLSSLKRHSSERAPVSRRENPARRSSRMTSTQSSTSTGTPPAADMGNTPN